MWIVLLLVHLFSNTGYNIVLRHAASERKIDRLLLAAVMSTAIAVPAAIGIVICGVDFSRFDTLVVWGLVGYVVTTLLFHVFNAKSLEHTEASVFTFLYNLRIGFVSLLGIMLLSEPVNVLRLAGGGLVFLAGVLIIERLRTNRMGALLSVITAVLISFVTMFEKGMIGAVGYTNSIFPTAIIVAVLLWVMVLLRKTPIDRKTLTSRSVLMLLPLRCASAYGFTLALSFGALLSVSTYVSSLAVITTSVVGIIFLKERDLLLNKIIAAAVAVAGITLSLFAG
jgi:drug/metabolite transporter (DMT)-like permease